MKDHCCGTCKWQEHETIGASVFENDMFVCKNPDSRYHGAWVGFAITCDKWTDWEEK